MNLEVRAGHKASTVATSSGVDPHRADASGETCDDDRDDDDNAPTGSAANGADDDVLDTWGGRVVMQREAALAAPPFLESAGLRPSRGHARGTEHPPRDA